MTLSALPLRIKSEDRSQVFVPQPQTQTQPGKVQIENLTLMKAATGQQPNLNIMAQGLQMVATELVHVPNVPANQQGNQIQQIQQTLVGINTQLSRGSSPHHSGRQHSRLGYSRGRKQSQQLRLRTHTCLANSPLVPFRHHTINAVINNFPDTPGAISTLTHAQLDIILVALAAPINGTIAIKRNRLHKTIGLTEH
jgi:hypothetical protein